MKKKKQDTAFGGRRAVNLLQDTNKAAQALITGVRAVNAAIQKPSLQNSAKETMFAAHARIAALQQHAPPVSDITGSKTPTSVTPSSTPPKVAVASRRTSEHQESLSPDTVVHAVESTENKEQPNSLHVTGSNQDQSPRTISETVDDQKPRKRSETVPFMSDKTSAPLMTSVCNFDSH